MEPNTPKNNPNTTTNIFVKHPKQSWSHYFKGVGLAFSLTMARFLIWFLYHALNTPFGLCVYLFSVAYSKFGTQGIVIFPSQIYAGHYVAILIWYSVALPLLMLIPPIRTFFDSQIGEKAIEKRVGRYGIRPFMGAISGPIFLSWLDSFTENHMRGIDLVHQREIVAHILKVQMENRSDLIRELVKIQDEYVPQLEKEEGSRDPVAVEEMENKKQSLWDAYNNRGERATEAGYEMLFLAATRKEEGSPGWVSEFSDHVKDFLRGKERNASFSAIDKGLHGSFGLDRYRSSS